MSQCLTQRHYYTSQSSCFSDTISVMVYNCLRHILCFRAITRAKSSMMELTSIVRSNSFSILINISMFRRPCPFVDRWALFIRRSFENERSPVQFVTIIQRYTRSNISTFGKHDCMVFSRIGLYMCATASRWWSHRCGSRYCCPCISVCSILLRGNARSLPSDVGVQQSRELHKFAGQAGLQVIRKPFNQCCWLHREFLRRHWPNIAQKAKSGADPLIVLTAFLKRGHQAVDDDRECAHTKRSCSRHRLVRLRPRSIVFLISFARPLRVLTIFFAIRQLLRCALNGGIRRS